MNDPGHRHIPDSFDDDAIFADIVAHLNDDVAEADGPARSPAEDPTADSATDEATDEPSASGVSASGVSDAGADGPPPGETPGEDGRQPGDKPPVPLTPDGPEAIVPPQVWRAHEVDDEYEEHFEPPPTKPLPAGDLQFWAIIAGMGGGPLLLLYLVYFNHDASRYWTLAAIAISLGGFALLVSRLPGHHEDDDDDGARL